MQAYQLPIAKHKKEIVEAINQNRVTIISGRTGCGKSTQIPKYLYQQLPMAKIAVCEPRRIAAISLARRVCEELKTILGDFIGYKIGMEAKASNQCRVTFITYGILIQQLLFHPHIEYTHIILDQVHERSLEMDFTFIALKKLLDTSGNKSIKLILMSATLNSDQFAKYFSVHKSSQKFLMPEIEYFVEKQKTGKKKKNKKKIEKLRAEIHYNRQDYVPSKKIDLPESKTFEVHEYFMDDLDAKEFPKYKLNSDIQIQPQTYNFCLELVQKHLQNKKGDILIFVPGLFEIRTLKNKLIKQLRIDEASIVQVHSIYSEDLYRKLFVDKTPNKIIITTNMGESSITLPFCKVVIDFCLTRKCITAKTQGYERLETRIASKANLTQRAGRVGRVDNGDVYRLISRETFSKMENYDFPEIKSSTLDMVILKAKQIDLTCHSKLFEDPYDVFLHAIDPPELEQIHCAIQNLLTQGALYQEDEGQIKENLQKYTGNKLKMSQVGTFMVSLPCDPKISKMILFSFHLGIDHTIIDIAAIMMCQKNFFQPEQKRQNIQSFMNYLIQYDQGFSNDFYLQQQIFEQWQKNFYVVKPSKKIKNNQQQQMDVQNFCDYGEISQKQWRWCAQRSISPRVMRDILKNRQSLKEKLVQNQFNLNKKDHQPLPNNYSILVCLLIACQQTTCHLQWKNPDYWQDKPDIQNYLLLQNHPKITTPEKLNSYFSPFPKPEYDRSNPNVIKIRGQRTIYSKLLLPKVYTKSHPNQKTSQLFQYISNDIKKGKLSKFSQQQPVISGRKKQTAIPSESINKIITRFHRQQEYLLVTDRIFESKGRNYTGSCALLQKNQWIMMMMIVARQAYLQAHPSCQFYQRVIINGVCYTIPYYINNSDLEAIQKLRQAAVGYQMLDSSQSTTHQSIFLDLIKNLPPLPKYQKWNSVFDQIQNHIAVDPDQLIEEVSYSVGLYEYSPNYFERYRMWKRKIYHDQIYNYLTLTIQKSCLICSQCWNNKIFVIGDLKDYNWKTNSCRFSTQCRIKMNDIFCPSKHRLGVIDKGQFINIQRDKVLIYCPFEKTFPLHESSLPKAEKQQKQGLRSLLKNRSQIHCFQCDICVLVINDNNTGEEYVERFTIQRGQKQPSQIFFKKIIGHMESIQHSKNVQKLLQW